MEQRDDAPGTSDSDSPQATSDASKDAFFERVATLADEMIDRHGRDFAMGTLVLAAKFIAEGKPLRGAGDGKRDG